VALIDGALFRISITERWAEYKKSARAANDLKPDLFKDAEMPQEPP
jgi:hypothetical protein